MAELVDNLYLDTAETGGAHKSLEAKSYTPSNAFPVSFAVQQTGRWYNHLCEQSLKLQTLPENWDGYNSPAVEPQVAHHACNVLSSVERTIKNSPSLGLLNATLGAPYLIPISGGALQAEWHFDNVYIEIFFDKDLSMTAEFYSEGNNIDRFEESEELELRDGEILAPKLIGWFRRAQEISYS